MNLVVSPTVTAKWAKGTGGPAGDETQNLVVSTLQGGGRRGYRINAESAAGGHLVPFQKIIRSGARDENGDLPPEVWAERPVAATLNCGDNTSESRATELIVSVTGDHTHTLTAEGHDASEDGTGQRTPMVASEMGVRRLTPLECERLQGFPDNWTATSNGKPQRDSARYQQMGNAVAVPCVEWIAKRIVEGSGA